MAAKTVGDFQGLFADLPDLPGDNLNDAMYGVAQAPGTPPPAACYAARRRRGPLRGPARALLLFVLVLVAANIAVHALMGWVTPLVWLAVIAAVVVVVTKRARRGNQGQAKP
jgi:hypothetical protein